MEGQALFLMVSTVVLPVRGAESPFAAMSAVPAGFEAGHPRKQTTMPSSLEIRQLLILPGKI
jgi:hypothetical protein